MLGEQVHHQIQLFSLISFSDIKQTKQNRKSPIFRFPINKSAKFETLTQGGTNGVDSGQFSDFDPLSMDVYVYVYVYVHIYIWGVC